MKYLNFLFCILPSKLKFLSPFFWEGLRYRGNFTRDATGEECQYWASEFPNARANWDDRWYLDAIGRHNNCRNTYGGNMYHALRDRPWCVRGSKLTSGQTYRVMCNVPRCFECNFGDGAGQYPGIILL